MNASENFKVKALGFLNAHAGELSDIVLAGVHARSVQKNAEGDREDRRALSGMFLSALVAGTARRRDLTAGDVDTLATQARELAEALIKTNLLAEVFSSGPMPAPAPAPAPAP